MRRRQGFLFFYLCAAIGALILLAAGLPQLSFRSGRSFILNGDQAPDASSSALAARMGDLGYWRVLLAAILLVTLGYFVLTLIFSASLRWQMLRRLARMLLVVLLFYLIISRLIGTLEPLPPPLIAGIWYFWRRSLPVANPMTALAQAAIESIQAGGDVQSVVLRCYLEMSQVLGQQRGIERAPAMTPREFARHLAASGVRDEHIQQLTRLFEGARYGAQPPSAGDERAAVECLTAIVQAYGGAA